MDTKESFRLELVQLLSVSVVCLCCQTRDMIFVIPSATTAPAPFNTMARSKSSKSSGTCCNLVMALLTLWSMVSLIVIVVWATSPHMKGLAQCNVAQQVWTTVCLLV